MSLLVKITRAFCERRSWGDSYYFKCDLSSTLQVSPAIDSLTGIVSSQFVPARVSGLSLTLPRYSKDLETKVAVAYSGTPLTFPATRPSSLSLRSRDECHSSGRVTTPQPHCHPTSQLALVPIRASTRVCTTPHSSTSAGRPLEFTLSGGENNGGAGLLRSLMAPAQWCNCSRK